MTITDVRIRRIIDEGSMKAVVSVTFDNQLALHDIKVIELNDRRFIVMPNQRSSKGKYRDVCHPITASFRETLESCVLAEYDRVKKAMEDGEMTDDDLKSQYIFKSNSNIESNSNNSDFEDDAADTEKQD